MGPNSDKSFDGLPPYVVVSLPADLSVEVIPRSSALSLTTLTLLKTAPALLLMSLRFNLTKRYEMGTVGKMLSYTFGFGASCLAFNIASRKLDQQPDADNNHGDVSHFGRQPRHIDLST